MITLTIYLTSGSSDIFSFENPESFEKAWKQFKKEHPELADVTISQYSYIFGSLHWTLCYFSRNARLAVTSDEYKTTIAKGHAVVLNRKGINVNPINNAIYLTSYSPITGEWTHRFLSNVYTDSTVTVATAMNALFEMDLPGFAFDMGDRLTLYTKFTNTEGVHLVTVDHDQPLDSFLVTRDYCNADTLRVIGLDPSSTATGVYCQSVTLSFCDYTAVGVAPGKQPQVTIGKDVVKLVKSDNKVAGPYNDLPLEGRFLHFKMYERDIVAELMTVDEFLDSEYMTMQLREMSNEFYENPRLSMSSSRARILYNGKTYNTIPSAMEDLEKDIAARLVETATYDDLNYIQLMDFLTAYVYINRASRRIEEAKSAEGEAFTDCISRAMQCLTIASNNTTSRNSVDIANQVIKLNAEVFALMTGKM